MGNRFALQQSVYRCSRSRESNYVYSLPIIGQPTQLRTSHFGEINVLRPFCAVIIREKQDYVGILNTWTWKISLYASWVMLKTKRLQWWSTQNERVEANWFRLEGRVRCRAWQSDITNTVVGRQSLCFNDVRPRCVIAAFSTLLHPLWLFFHWAQFATRFCG